MSLCTSRFIHSMWCRISSINRIGLKREVLDPQVVGVTVRDGSRGPNHLISHSKALWNGPWIPCVAANSVETWTQPPQGTGVRRRPKSKIIQWHIPHLVEQGSQQGAILSYGFERCKIWNQKKPLASCQLTWLIVKITVFPCKTNTHVSTLRFPLERKWEGSVIPGPSRPRIHPQCPWLNRWWWHLRINQDLPGR